MMRAPQCKLRAAMMNVGTIPSDGTGENLEILARTIFGARC